MPLSTYRKKRDFTRTEEPRGKAHRRKGFAFVIQKHAARSLHYDFRLELDGVLLSWAVPKGPSLDPGVKRLAVQTEDHPIEYANFEGVIPEGEYGAGPVLIWDRGVWKPEGDAREAYRKGRLSFELEGEKLHGGWHLVRTRKNGKQQSWLLMKRKDAWAQRGSGAAIVDRETKSARTGRTIEALGDKKTGASAKPGRVSGSKPRSARSRKPREEVVESPDPSALAGARRAALPRFIAPELATLVDAAPAGDDWLHELKLDGYRMLLRVERGRSSFFTRRGLDWSGRVPGLLAALEAIALEAAYFDGELVVLGPDGVSDFQRLQNSLSAGRDRDCVYYAFDLLHLGGYDLRALPLVERKRLLAATVAGLPSRVRERMRFHDHMIGHGPEIFASACKLGAEGIVSKRADARYSSERTRAWLKVKCLARQEFVVGGYSEPRGARSYLGALLLGTREDGVLTYAGKVGTGFSEQSLKELHGKLRALERKSSPFTPAPRGAEARDVHWLRPELVAEVEFSERTRDGRVRHASFRGLREDKPAAEVRTERAREPEPAAAPRTHATAETPSASRSKPNSRELALPPALRSIRLTHPERVLYAEQGITKADLALYYARVATRMLPHLARRPLMLVRCPEGQGSECFHQKHPGKTTPAAVRRIKIAEKKATAEAMFVEDVEGLLALVQIGALEIHSWGSRVDRIEFPDQLIFDLDPDVGLPFARTVEAAHALARELDALGLASFVKTTGGKGLHLVVPIEPTLEWDRAKELTKAVADRLAEKQPTKYLTTIAKAKRKGKVLIDYLRNARGATAVCVYSTRARAGAPVSAPIAWNELEDLSRPDRFTLSNLPERLATLERDPWRDFEARRAQVDRAVATLRV